MGRSKSHLVLLAFACAFSSCCAEVALGVKLSPQTTSFHHTITSALPLSVYRSPPHQSTAVQPNITGSINHTTTLQTTDQRWVTTAPASHMTAQAGANISKAYGQTSSTAVTSTAANTAASGQATTQAMETVTPAVKNTTVSPDSQITTHVDTVTNTTIESTTSKTQTTTAAIYTTATDNSTANPTTSSINHTTSGSPTATAMTNATTTHQGTHTTIPSTTMMVRPTLAPQPSPIPTGTYTIFSSNKTCIKAVMGLQLMALSTQKKQMEYLTVNPNATQISGSCGMVQSVLNITFIGGFISFVFVKKDPTYYVSTIEAELQLPSEGILYYIAIRQQHFTAKLGNSFKCASKQTFGLERTYQLFIVNMQLQAFDIVGNQFGKEEECFLDKTTKAVPIVVGLSILGLLVIVFVTFLISRKKPHRGYERI
ncbi:lysosome-associated membrane glycoprotein 3 isoform X1 [Lagopus muta]|uniref:lysosome-associated membrane glycoprotein 3 isoform X1 n=1 Tax=Lagopus muta TaxID=64668 RepID=UPI00209CB22B|nr:lysosome-associated membrane glycoprotein 3 isoform X1 [Lagopus muta]